jgi:hypothetical protein
MMHYMPLLNPCKPRADFATKRARSIIDHECLAVRRAENADCLGIARPEAMAAPFVGVWWFSERYRMNQLRYVSAIGIALVLAGSSAAFAQVEARHYGAARVTRVELPLVRGWFNGKPAFYVSTDASDAGVAKDMGANFVPALANAITAQPSAVDDIYAVTNFAQSNILPSAPIPAGPGNKSAAYTPLWQVSTITWSAGAKPYTLKSEADVRAAESAKLVTVSKTNIVVNCPIVFTPEGGRLPGTEFSRE